MRCVGILRESQNSPGRQSDDEAILRDVLQALRRHGVEAELWRPEMADATDFRDWDMVLPMCETYARLKRLDALAQASPAIFLNSPGAVLGCYRESLLDTLASVPGVRLPKHEKRGVRDAAFAPPEFAAGRGFWMKRGDVHNTCERDVVFARDERSARLVLKDFGQREITRVIVQEHVEGDIVKFYGVGPGQWLTWFHPDPASARHLPFHPEDLAASAEAGARALGLCVFGGDAIISPEGRVYLIDLNSWPSFARVRQEASVQISRLALSRLAGKKSQRNL